MIPRPTIAAYVPATRSALIAHGDHLTDWMTVDDVYEQAFAWFDLARELRGRGLAVEAVEAVKNEAATPEDAPAVLHSGVLGTTSADASVESPNHASRGPATCWRCGGGLDPSYGPPAEPICDACYAIVVEAS